MKHLLESQFMQIYILGLNVINFPVSVSTNNQRTEDWYPQSRFFEMKILELSNTRSTNSLLLHSIAEKLHHWRTRTNWYTKKQKSWIKTITVAVDWFSASSAVVRFSPFVSVVLTSNLQSKLKTGRRLSSPPDWSQRRERKLITKLGWALGFKAPGPT